MAKDKETTRRIGLKIDGAPVVQTVNSVRAEIRRLTKELNRADFKSKEYTDNMKRIGELKSILAQHNAQLREAAEQTEKLSKGAKVWPKLTSDHQHFQPQTSQPCHLSIRD